MVTVKDLGDGGQVAGKVPLCSLGDATAAPGDQDVFGESTVGVLDFDEGELNAAFVEILDQVRKLTICDDEWLVGAMAKVVRRSCGPAWHSPPVLSTFRMLSFAPESWKAFRRGAWTEKRAQRA